MALANIHFPPYNCSPQKRFVQRCFVLFFFITLENTTKLTKTLLYTLNHYILGIYGPHVESPYSGLAKFEDLIPGDDSGTYLLPTNSQF